VYGRTAVLKVKYSDFKQITRSHSEPRLIAAPEELRHIIHALLAPLFPPRKGIRLLGVSLSTLGNAHQAEECEPEEPALI
jgi:DNA polymerase-4